MQSKVFASLMVALSFSLTTAPTYAQLAAEIMSYQGQLMDNVNNPVPDGNYFLVFTVWDHPVDGTMVWSEEQSVETSGGSFQVNLGRINPLEPDVFGGTTNPAGRWIQIQVGDDDPMIPRIELGVNPFAFISTRLYGDVVTEPGKLTVSDGGKAISIGIGELQASMSLDAGGDAISIGIGEQQANMSLDVGGDAISIGIGEQQANMSLDAGGDAISIGVGELQASMSLDVGGDAISIGVGELQANMSMLVGELQEPVVDFMADATGGSASFKGTSTLNPEIKLIADDAGASLNLLLNEDARNVYSASQWGAWSDLAMFRLADPRPNPDFIITTDGTGSKIEMGDIEGSGLIENVVLSIAGDDTGGNISLLGGSPLTPSVNIIANQTGATIDLTCDSDEKPNVEIATDCNGANIAFGLAGDIPTKPSIDIGIDGAGANIDLACDSPNKPTVGINTDCNGANIAFGFIGDVPLKPSIDMGIDDLSAYMSLLIGELQEPVVDFLADATGGSLDLSEHNSLAEMEMHSRGASIFDPEGNLAVEVELVALTMYDVSSSAKTEMHAGGLNVYTTGGALTTILGPDGIVAPKGNFGSGNTNAGTNTLVVGSSNSAGGNFSSVLGGSGNNASGGSATVAGGVSNSASFGGAFVGGGQSNTASGVNAVVSGGNGNIASGGHAAIPGGASNNASGNYSLAGGLRAKAVHQGAFVWADATGSNLSSDLVNQYKVRASGGTYIYSNSEASVGVRLSSGSSQWQSISDRNAKRNIRPVDGEEILRQLQQLPVSRWSYKDQDENIEHIGPMAQDFYALFSIGEDDKHISMLDPAGVALAGVKELLGRIEELESRIAELEAEKQ